MEQSGEIILYQANDSVKLDVVMQNETVWLSQEQIATLFGTKRPAITKHLSNIYKSGELEESSTCSILEHMGTESKQRYYTKYYNLDAILSVGYRVNSKNATLFRQWANKVLKDYLIKGYAINSRLQKLENKITSKFNDIDNKLEEHSKKIDFFVRTSLPPIEGIFFDGQIFDALVFVSDLIKSASKSIILVDNYIDEKTLLLLSKRNNDVKTTIYTKSINKQLQNDINTHNKQYSPIEIKTSSKFHDRFLIIDNEVYHIGASLKDLGKKLFAFSRLNISKQNIINNI